MTNIINTDVVATQLKAQIDLAIRETVEEVAAPLIEKMHNDIHAAVSKKLSVIACSLLTEYDVHAMGQRIEIRVRNTL